MTTPAKANNILDSYESLVNSGLFPENEARAIWFSNMHEFLEEGLILHVLVKHPLLRLFKDFEEFEKIHFFNHKSDFVDKLGFYIKSLYEFGQLQKEHYPKEIPREKFLNFFSSRNIHIRNFFNIKKDIDETAKKLGIFKITRHKNFQTQEKFLRKFIIIMLFDNLFCFKNKKLFTLKDPKTEAKYVTTRFTVVKIKRSRAPFVCGILDHKNYPYLVHSLTEAHPSDIQDIADTFPDFIKQSNTIRRTGFCKFQNITTFTFTNQKGRDISFFIRRNSNISVSQILEKEGLTGEQADLIGRLIKIKGLCSLYKLDIFIKLSENHYTFKGVEYMYNNHNINQLESLVCLKVENLLNLIKRLKKLNPHLEELGYDLVKINRNKFYLLKRGWRNIEDVFVEISEKAVAKQMQERFNKVI